MFLGVDFCDCVKQLTCGNQFRGENGFHEVTADRLFGTGSLGCSRRYRVARADGDPCLSQLAPFAVVDATANGRPDSDYSWGLTPGLRPGAVDGM